MKRTDIKSRCPINFSLEVFGDAWSLLIVRDMLALGKKTYGEFLESEERIGPSVLADRLAHLEKRGIITKNPDGHDKRKMIYMLTPLGIQSLPIVYELAVWGSHASPNPKATEVWFTAMKLDRSLVIEAWLKALRTGSSFFSGPNSVVVQLGL